MNGSRLISLLLLPAFCSAMCSGCATVERANAKSEYTLVYLPQELEIELALAAGPEHVRSEAAVYIFGTSGYQQVRSGTNGFTCLVNRDGHQNDSKALRPTCWDAEGSATIVPVMLRVGELIAQGIAANEIEEDIEQGFQNERLSSPRKSGIAYMLRGDVLFDEKTQTVSETIFPPHYMIYAPGVSNADIGMTEKAFAGNPSLPLVYDGYSGGSRTAYIIVVASDGVEHGQH